jgi:hypothetical protein
MKLSKLKIIMTIRNKNTTQKSQIGKVVEEKIK